jgi:hypothetical protein
MDDSEIICIRLWYQFSRHSEPAFAFVAVFKTCRVMFRRMHLAFRSDSLAIIKELFVKVVITNVVRKLRYVFGEL